MAVAGAAGSRGVEQVNRAEVGVAGTIVQAHTITFDLRADSVPPACVAVPRQLPAAPACFVGRDAELAELARHAKSASVLTVTGPAGVGKTALALAWLHGVRKAFPDGQLFGDLQGYSPSPRTSPDQILGQFLRALGVAPQLVPTDHDERVALFRSLTTDRRLLIMLDNVSAPRDVLPLLPGPPHARAVITSRHRMPGLVARGARTVELGTLPDEAGMALLTRIVGEPKTHIETEAIGAMVRACAGLPLALWLVSAQLVNRPHRAAADLVAEFGAECAALDVLTADDLSVRGALDLSYRHLPDAVARTFCLVSGYPGPDFSPPVAAAASGAGEADVVRTLRTLVDVHLVEELDVGRYRLHDLVRRYAGERAVGDDGRAELDNAELRMSQWYLITAYTADKVVMPTRRRLTSSGHHPSLVPSFDRPEAALDWTEAHMVHFLAVVRRHPHHALSYRLVEALWSMFLHRKHYPEWLETHQVALVTAHAAGDVRAETLLLNHFGLGLYGVGRFAEAGDTFRHALRLHRATADRVGEAMALNSIGLVLHADGRLIDAADHFERALGLQMELGQIRGEALTRVNLARIAMASGEATAARTHLLRARSVFREIADNYNAARVDVELAVLAVGDGDWDRARDLLNASLSVMSTLKADKELARVHRELAELERRTGDDVAVRRHLDAMAHHQQRVAPPGNPAVSR